MVWRKRIAGRRTTNITRMRADEAAPVRAVLPWCSEPTTPAGVVPHHMREAAVILPASFM